MIPEGIVAAWILKVRCKLLGAARSVTEFVLSASIRAKSSVSVVLPSLASSVSATNPVPIFGVASASSSSNRLSFEVGSAGDCPKVYERPNGLRKRDSSDCMG